MNYIHGKLCKFAQLIEDSKFYHPDGRTHLSMAPCASGSGSVQSLGASEVDSRGWWQDLSKELRICVRPAHTRLTTPENDRSGGRSKSARNYSVFQLCKIHCFSAIHESAMQDSSCTRCLYTILVVWFDLTIRVVSFYTFSAKSNPTNICQFDIPWRKHTDWFCEISDVFH